jgi:hypothetical protein
MTNKRNRGLGQFVYDEIKATNEFTETLRAADRAINELDADSYRADQEGWRKGSILDCREIMAQYPEDDPRHIAARRKLAVLNSIWYRLWLRLLGGLRSAAVVLRQELFYAALGCLKFLLIIVFNLVFFGFVIWLIIS